MTKDEARERAALLVRTWYRDAVASASTDAQATLAGSITALILTTHAEAKEEAAKVADERQMQDRERYQHETDWRQPYASNRVIRASMDIATAIRAHGDKG